MTYRSTILFVEDESDLRDLVSEVLSAKGFEVLLASDGYEAVRLLTEHHVDLLLTDVVMPGISGFELARQAKLMRPGLRVLYTTGYAEQAQGRHGVRHGKLLTKPIRAAELVSEVSQALSG
jgi:two-component system, cell cycle sensor histidine kinase and response regulator CckA